MDTIEEKRGDFMSENQPPKYPYARKMLEEIKSEYAIENERENKIATKASAFITVVVAIITLYIPLIPFNNMIEFFRAKHSCVVICLVILSLLLLVVGFVVLMVAFGFFIKAYGVKGHNRVEVNDLLAIANQNEYKQTEDQVNQGLVAQYHQILCGFNGKAGNMEINTQSALANKTGITLTVIGFAIMSIATIALRIMIVV